MLLHKTFRCLPKHVIQRNFCKDVAVSEENTELSPEPTSVSQFTAEQIEAARNVSGLSDSVYQRKILKKFTGFPPDATFKRTHMRKTFVNHPNEETQLNGGICWPSKAEMKCFLDAEETHFPSFERLKAETEAAKTARETSILERERSIEENLVKLKAVREKMLANEKVIAEKDREKKAKTEELVREVREYIGYNINPNDPKFKEVMEQKEAERKAAEKEARKIAKKEAMMRRLLSQKVRASPEKKEEETPAEKSSKTPTDA